MTFRPESSTPQQIAQFQEHFYQANNVYMDPKRFAEGRTSWAMALNNHPVTTAENSELVDPLPQAIRDFHLVSSHLISQALSGDVNLESIRRRITAGVPDSTLDMIQRSVSAGITMPFSSRPDIARGPESMKIFEYNVDGGADKGNTQAINDCLTQALGRRTLGHGLARLFVEQVRAAHPDNQFFTVATILPDHYRTDYDAQNAYFARAANEEGSKLGVRWVSRKLSELKVDSGVFTEIDGITSKIDIIDKEFKLPGFLDKDDPTVSPLEQYDFKDESAVVNTVLDGDVELLGTLLPLQDKVLLASVFDPKLEDYCISFLGMAGQARLQNIRRWHSQSFVVDPIEPGLTYAGKFFSWDELAKPDPAQGFVLKRGGDNLFTTGSKGVDFSIGKSPRKWQNQLEGALERARQETAYSIIQPLEPSQRFQVEYITSSNSPKGRTADVPVRFAPYYVLTPSGFMLGSVLVTAGTDSEVSKFLGSDLSRTSFNIHGVRDNTYQAAELTND